MAYRISGKVLAVGQTQTFQSKTGNPYNMRDLVITIRKFDPYTGQPSDDAGNTPKFTFMGDKCQQLDSVRVGDIITIHFDISGRSYEKDGKREYFTDVRPFRVDALRQGQQTVSQPSFGSQNTNPFPPAPNVSHEAPMAAQGNADDLPF